jgi:hypothetical protein
MESRSKFFKLFLVVTIFLNAALAILNYHLLTKDIPKWRTDWGVLLLTSSLIFFLISSIFVFFFLKKYPSQPISNITEGLVFTFAIITFLISTVDLLLICIFFDIAINLQKKSDNPITQALLFVSASFVIAITCAVFISVNSLRLLKIIRKNRLILAQQIKNIGVGE